MKKIALTSLTFLSLSLSVLMGCASLKTFEEQLKEIKEIVSVEKVETIDKKGFKEIYNLYFNQLINWADPQSGYFRQRVQLFYNGNNNINEYRVFGYYVTPIELVSPMEITKRYHSNIINIEYRFFGESQPSDFNLGGTKYYDQLTSKNACQDFHNIICSLNSVLGGKKVFFGGSKGGYDTETMAYFYPNDADSFISYDAPFCNSPYDKRLFEFVYTKIGDDCYGEQIAANYRNILLEFVKQALSEDLRYDIMDGIFDDSIHLELTKKDVTDDELYESQVSNVPVGIWMNDLSQFENIEKINNLPYFTQEEKEEKVDNMRSIILNGKPNISRYVEVPETPYSIIALTEMGDYAYDYKYLRDQNINIKTNKDRDYDIRIYTCLTKAQRDAFSYSNTLHNTLINDFYQKTTKEIIKIYGGNDPWYSVCAPQTSNNHIHVFVGYNGHRTMINSLSEIDQAVCWSIIDNLLDFH